MTRIFTAIESTASSTGGGGGEHNNEILTSLKNNVLDAHYYLKINVIPLTVSNLTGNSLHPV